MLQHNKIHTATTSLTRHSNAHQGRTHTLHNVQSVAAQHISETHYRNMLGDNNIRTSQQARIGPQQAGTDVHEYTKYVAAQRISLVKREIRCGTTQCVF